MFDYQAPANLLQDKIIAVTGAGAGIGRAAALSYAQHGATVVLIGKTTSKLEQVYDEIENAGAPQAAIFPMDLESTADSDYLNLASAIANEFGRLSGLLNNASLLGSISPLQNYPVDTWNKVMQVNVNATFAVTRHLLPLLQQEEQASIILTSSTVGREARAYWGAYGVSKFATEALMQTLHLELETTSNVRVNSVNPGATATAMRKQAFPAEDPGSLAQPQDIMPVYLYLMGKDSSGVSGQQFNAQ